MVHLLLAGWKCGFGWDEVQVCVMMTDGFHTIQSLTPTSLSQQDPMTKSATEALKRAKPAIRPILSLLLLFILTLATTTPTTTAVTIETRMGFLQTLANRLFDYNYSLPGMRACLLFGFLLWIDHDG